MGLLLWARLISSSRAAAGSATFPADVGSCTATCYNCSCAGNARSAVHLRISVYDGGGEVALCGWVVPLSARILRQTARLLTSHRPADTTKQSCLCRVWRNDVHCAITRVQTSATVFIRRERQCAYTIGTVPVSWAGHFQCYNINVFLEKKNIRKQSYQTAHANCCDLNSLKS